MWKKFWPADAPTVRVFWWDRESWSGKWGLFKEQRVRDTIKLWMDDNDLSLSLGYNIIHGIPNSENFAFMKKCNVIFVAGAKMIPPDSMSDLDRKGATIVLLRLGGRFELNKKLPGKDGYCYTEITCRNKADVAKAIQVGMDAWFSSPASRSIKESALNLKKAKSGEETRFLTQLRVELEGKVKNLEKNVQELQVSNRAEKENNERQKKQIVQLQSSLKDMDINIQQLTEEKAGLDQKVYVSEIRNRGLEAALKDKDYKITQLKTALENKKSEEEMQIVLAKNEVLKNLLEEKTEAEDEILGLRIDKERMAAAIEEKDIIIKQQAEKQAKMAEESQFFKTRCEVVLFSLKDKDIIIQQLTEEKAGLDQKVYVSDRSNRGLEAALKDKDDQIAELKTALENKKSEEEMQIVLAKNEVVLKKLLEEKTEAEDEILGLRRDKGGMAATIEEKDNIIKQQAEKQANMAEERQLLKARCEAILLEKAEAEYEKQELQRDKERMASQLSLAKESEQKYVEMKEKYLASLGALTEWSQQWSQQWQNAEELREKESKEQLLQVLDSANSCVDQSVQNSTVEIIAQVKQTGDHVIRQLQLSSALTSYSTNGVPSSETAEEGKTTPENALCKNSEMQKFCSTISKQLGNDWRSFGRELKLTGSTLDEIEKRYGKHGSIELVWSVLEKWAKTCETPNKDILIQALQAIQAEHVLRPMETNHQEVLKSLQPYLLQEMLDIQLLIPYLCRDDILNGTHIQQIMDIPGRYGKNFKFLLMLPSLGDKAFNAFVSALKESSQKHIADKLTGQPECENTVHQATPGIQPPDDSSETGVKQPHLMPSVQETPTPAGHTTPYDTEVVEFLGSKTTVKQLHSVPGFQDTSRSGHIPADDTEVVEPPTTETLVKQLHLVPDASSSGHMTASTDSETIESLRYKALMWRLEELKADTDEIKQLVKCD